MFKPAQSGRQDLIFEFPRGAPVSGKKSLQDLQAEQNNAEMNLASQGMALGLQETHNCLTDQAAKQLLVLQATQADGIEVAFEEMEDTQMGGKSVLGFFLLSQHQILVRGQ